MLAHRQLRPRRQDGFTLIELLVVVIIIGILAAIAIPVFLLQRNKANDAGVKSDLNSLAKSEEAYLTDSSTGYFGTGTVTYTSTNMPTGTPSLTSEGFKMTASDQGIRVKANGALGYCAVAKSSSGNYMVYDSTAGGLTSYLSTAYPTVASVTAAEGGANANATCQTAANIPASF